MTRFLTFNIILLFMNFSKSYFGVALVVQESLKENQRCKPSKTLQSEEVCAENLKCLPVLNEFENNFNVMRCIG